jgi:TrmH family RNA methyltransferase
MFKPSPKKISSLQNPLIKRLVKLRTSKNFRQEEQSVLVMGTIVVEELLASLKPKALFVSEGSTFNHRNQPYTTLTPEAVKKITGLPSYEGALGEFELPSESPLRNKKFIIVCDEIKDPGNLGTIVRTALAMNWEGIFLLPGSCDLFNDKTIRASRGGVFLLPFYHGTEEELEKMCKEGHLNLMIADTAGEPLNSLTQVKSCALLLGNESKGPSNPVLKLGKKVTIPLHNEVESLNVAVAGSILMYALKNL